MIENEWWGSWFSPVLCVTNWRIDSRMESWVELSWVVWCRWWCSGLYESVCKSRWIFVPNFHHNHKYKSKNPMSVVANDKLRFVRDTLPRLFSSAPSTRPALCRTNWGNGLQIDCDWRRGRARQWEALLQPSSAATVNWLESVQEQMQYMTAVYYSQDLRL